MSLIPDTLTIFITTKIPSYMNFIYNSKNTLPNTNTSILMSPIILLNSTITNPNILFDKTLFENQLREDKDPTLPTLIKATRDDYISKNIRSILNVLFAKGKIIYLGDYPFTIHTMTWNGNWMIQHKFSSSLTNIKDYLLANENKTIQENNLLNSLPPEVRTNNDKDYYLQYLTNLYLIKGSIDEPISNTELMANDNDMGINNILKSIKINRLPINLQFIINNYRSNYLIYISGIYYNLTTDPIILILFYTDKTYYDKPENYINIPKYIHQNAYLEELFNIFKEKRILLNSSNYNFWNIWKNLSYQQKSLEDLYRKLSQIIKKTPKLNYSNVESIMNNIESSQKEFYKIFIIYFQSFLNTLYAQKTYYKSTLLFLEELNNVYSGNILKTQLNIENENLIIQKDIAIFQCIVKKFEDSYEPPLSPLPSASTSNTKAKNIITYYKELYDRYIKIIFNLMKTKSFILFDKIKEDKELTDFYIFQNYTLNLMILSNYEYLKTYINECLKDYKDLLSKTDKTSSSKSFYLNTKKIGATGPPPTIVGGNPILQKISELGLPELGSKLMDKIKINIKSLIDKTILDNYITSLGKNTELYYTLRSKNTTDEEFIKNVNSIKLKSKLLVKDDKQPYYKFITNSILTYSMIVLIIYIILIILFQYLNYNGACLNYFIIQKEYSTFDYLYTKLFYKKLHEDSTFSIPFTIQKYEFNNDINMLKSQNISYFSQIIYCNSLICEYSLVYNNLNSQVNKIFSAISPELNESILINFCDATYTTPDLNIAKELFEEYDFKNNIMDIKKEFLNLSDYEETIKFQQYLLDIIDCGVYLKFLPKQEYISVNNWWLKNINIDNLNKNFDTMKDNLNSVVDIYQQLFQDHYLKSTDDPYVWLNYVFIYTEIKIQGDFNYIEMLSDTNLKNKLFDFCKAFIIIENKSTFGFNDIAYGDNSFIKKIISKTDDNTKKIYVINNLYNLLFPNYFNENEFTISCDTSILKKV